MRQVWASRNLRPGPDYPRSEADPDRRRHCPRGREGPSSIRRPCKAWPRTTASRWIPSGRPCPIARAISCCTARVRKRSSSPIRTARAATTLPSRSKVSFRIWTGAGAKPTRHGCAKTWRATSRKHRVRCARARVSNLKPWPSRSTPKTSRKFPACRSRWRICGFPISTIDCRKSRWTSPDAFSRKSKTGCASSTMSGSTTSTCRAIPARSAAANPSASGWRRRLAPA